jgi:hypothetical protein
MEDSQIFHGKGAGTRPTRPKGKQMKRLTSSLLITSILTSCLAPAALADSRGTNEDFVTKTAGTWQGDFKPGSWVRAVDSAATLDAGGVKMRATKGTSIYLASVEPGNVSVKLGKGQGRVFVDVPEGVNLSMDSGTDRVQASEGNFVLRYGAKRDLKVFTGDAHTSNPVERVPSARHWVSDKELALMGPDTRRRPASEVQGEQTQPQNAGEEAPTMSPTTTPTWTPTPQTTPTWTPTPTATVTPRTTTTTAVGEDFPWWAVGLGAVGLGTGLYFLLDDDDDDFQAINIVVSP